MAIVFADGDEDFEPIDWSEKIEFMDGVAWLPEQITEALVFFDTAQLDRWQPANDIEAILRSIPEGGAAKLERWGYLQAGNDDTRHAISKLECERRASPLMRYLYGTGALIAAVISMPAVFEVPIGRRLARHRAYVDLIPIVSDESLQMLLPA
ncbi:hypothetical protein [Parafrankia sp. BMG5.11]|uniref:hypothetical protein n=1 Tax=Parafrankia sp. BMG5.11 TaxID=222540 RepID=UPI00103AEFA7|nr:hypothetical protein [Parafrankia sp. BMG5.11]TCJ41397.1 hypothetical protein E0504_01990 [Parafrankia sp. BMG5.11]